MSGITVQAPVHEKTTHWPLVPTIFLTCLVLPIIFEIGSIRLSPYRIILLAMLLPCVWGWLNGMMGQTRVSDLLVLAIAVWSAVSFLAVHGIVLGGESAGIVFIGTLTPYLLARICIRNLRDFTAFVRSLAVIVLVLSPFAIIETVTGWNALLCGVGSLFQTFPDVAKPLRLGFDRVQGPFEHPILFGVFCGTALALCYFTHRRCRTMLSGAVLLTAGLSLSSGPLTALFTQVGMMVWDRLLRRFRNRWVLLGVFVAVSYALVDLISNRSPAEVFISYAAFNSETAYNRILIWEWSWVNIWQNPLFGLGNNDWQRLWFMTASVDMFWVQRALVHGLPVGLLFQVVFFTVVIRLIRLSNLTERYDCCRTGLMICLTALFLAGMTVHFWNATFVWLMFLLGSAGWLFEEPDVVKTTPVCANAEQFSARTPAGMLASA